MWTSERQIGELLRKEGREVACLALQQAVFYTEALSYKTQGEMKELAKKSFALIPILKDFNKVKVFLH